MPGAFGLCDGWHDTLTAAAALVEGNPAIDVFALYRQGRIQGDHIQLELPSTTPPDPYPDGLGPAGKSQAIRLAWQPMLHMPVFECPDCSRRCYRLHYTDGAWRCRTFLVSLKRRRKVSISPNTLAVSASVSGVGAISAPFFAASTWCTPWPSSWASVMTSRGLP